MAAKFESVEAGDTSEQNILTTHFEGETFTPNAKHTITSVFLLIFRAGSPGTLDINIYATSGGHPSGASLCSGSTDGNTLPTASPYEWREITLGAGAILNSGTMYAIVANITGGSAFNKVAWRTGSIVYAGGDREYSDDSGGSWATQSGAVNLFQEWGDAIASSRGWWSK